MGKDVKAVMEKYLEVCAGELKKTGTVKRSGSEVEVESQASDACTERCEPVHQGAVRIQGQARVEKCEGVGVEEVEGGCELSARRGTRQLNCMPRRRARRADSP